MIQAVTQAIDQNDFQKAQEPLAALLADRIGTNRMAEARKAFAQRTGEMHDDEFGFEQWMNLFLEELFFWLRDENGRTEYEKLLDSAPADAPWRGIGNIRRSVYRISKVKDDYVELEDLWDETKIRLAPDRVARLDKGEVIQAFFADWNGGSYMLNGVLVHLKETRDQVLDTVKKFRKRELKLAKKEKRKDGLDRKRFDPLRIELERVWVRAARYRKLSPEVIYREGLSKLVA